MESIEIDPVDCKVVMEKFINKYKDPAFGSLPKREIDILVFQMMQELGLITSAPSIYELVEKLRVTRSRASGLIYDSSLRSFEKDQMEDKLKQAISRPVVKKDDENHICFEIENPLLIDYLRQKFRDDGHALDGTFSPTLVRLSHEMAAKLVVDYVPEDIQKVALKKLYAEGVKDKTLNGVLQGVLTQFGKKIAGDVGATVLSDISDDCMTYITEQLKELVDLAALFDRRVK